MVSRMVGMKGFDLVQSIADGLVDRGIELVLSLIHIYGKI